MMRKNIDRKISCILLEYTYIKIEQQIKHTKIKVEPIGIKKEIQSYIIHPLQRKFCYIYIQIYKFNEIYQYSIARLSLNNDNWDLQKRGRRSSLIKIYKSKLANLQNLVNKQREILIQTSTDKGIQLWIDFYIKCIELFQESSLINIFIECHKNFQHLLFSSLLLPINFYLIMLPINLIKIYLTFKEQFLFILHDYFQKQRFNFINSQYDSSYYILCITIISIQYSYNINILTLFICIKNHHWQYNITNYFFIQLKSII